MIRESDTKKSLQFDFFTILLKWRPEAAKAARMTL